MKKIFKSYKNVIDKKKLILLTLLLAFLSVSYVIISYLESKAVFSTDTKINKIIDNMEIYIGGEAAGIKLLSTGVLVIDNEQDNGIKIGDIILEVEEHKIETNVELQNYIQEYKNKKINLKLNRNGSIISQKVYANYSEESNVYELGLWVKDSSAGVGTISFYDNISGRFAALGHGITETRNSVVFPISSGGLVKTKITDIKKGASNSPGDMRGTLYKEVIGQIRKNTINGIYGDIEDKSSFTDKETIKIGTKMDIKEDTATIFCTLLDNSVNEYKIEITKVLYGSKGNKNMMIRVTDETLLEQTGGIIQGMSGSPIVQNGKLIGVVTHVFLNDPTQGYGVFIENMLEDMSSIK